MRIKLNQEQSKLFIEMLLPELIKIEKEKEMKKRATNRTA